MAAQGGGVPHAAGDDGRIRCAWAAGPWLLPYHDREWGVPVHDDTTHFEFLILEGAQAGLSWLTVLKRRDGYRKAFAGFDPAKVARFTPAKVERLLADPGIIRNRAKVISVVANARAFLEVQAEHGSFDAYLWSFTGGRTIVNRPASTHEIPATTELSGELSADLRRRGFQFVGPTVCYSHLQAAGLVNDHVADCYRYRELTSTRRRRPPAG